MPRRSRSAPPDPSATLFTLPLKEFTATRNALSAVLKKNGQVADAVAVKALAKPSVSAWAVNQLHWRHQGDLAELLAAGERFRQAQRAQSSGGRTDIRSALDDWRALLATMAARAGDMLREIGHLPTPDLMQRVSSTLEALSAGMLAHDRSRVGRLTADLPPPGFEALAALVPRSGSRLRGTAHPRVIPFNAGVRDGQAPAPKPKLTPAAQRAAARKVVDLAKRQLAAARTTARTSEAALKNADARARLATDERVAAERQRAEVEARFERAVAAADVVVAEARRLAREAKDAAQVVTDAERDLELARHALDL